MGHGGRFRPRGHRRDSARPDAGRTDAPTSRTAQADHTAEPAPPSDRPVERRFGPEPDRADHAISTPPDVADGGAIEPTEADPGQDDGLLMGRDPGGGRSPDGSDGRVEVADGVSPEGEPLGANGLATDADGLGVPGSATHEPVAGVEKPACTPAQMRRFIKSRVYVPMHELRRRFAINGGEDDVTPVSISNGRVFVGLPSREGRMLGELLRQGEVGYELSLDPESPVVVGVFPMRPVPRS